MKNVLDTLTERGFIKQVVFEEDLRKLLETEKTTFYVGFDPTADSLHVGHYIAIMAMAHMQRAGHKPIILIGGGTAYIGDPSGRADMRGMMSAETIARNGEYFKKQLSRFLSFEGANAAIMADNADWLKNINYLDFLRDVGVHFSVNKMLAAECFRSRMEKGLSFMEFNYMLLQSYDFLMLYKKFGCRLQMGGNDQWSNMLFGADLIRRKEREDAFAVTFTLLENSAGEKMGKTQKGALWLDANKTTPYEFYQYFRNIEDAKVAECLRLLTFMPVAEIEELTRNKDERINAAKARLAFEVTKLIHGAHAAEEAGRQSVGAFEGGASGGDMPVKEVEGDAGMQVAELLALIELASSKTDARQLIAGGGVRINGSKVSGFNSIIGDYTDDNEFVLHKGKKGRWRVVLK
ncbi:MAG: tyrosine--tRNA ligase [Firmicutes bacterium]|nr:tyrosine--tRNA ligase [Bacillota bacterium]